jgi:hypothetical protein
VHLVHDGLGGADDRHGVLLSKILGKQLAYMFKLLA